MGCGASVLAARQGNGASKKSDTTLIVIAVVFHASLREKKRVQLHSVPHQTSHERLDNPYMSHMSPSHYTSPSPTPFLWRNRIRIPILILAPGISMTISCKILMSAIDQAIRMSVCHTTQRSATRMSLRSTTGTRKRTAIAETRHHTRAACTLACGSVAHATDSHCGG